MSQTNAAAILLLGFSWDGVHAMICPRDFLVHSDLKYAGRMEDPKTFVHSNASRERNELRFRIRTKRVDTAGVF
jgi:hypothetical protein